MYIKLKDKREILVFSGSSLYDKQCNWTGKTIKVGKNYYYSHWSGAASGVFCSPAALKAASNARL